MLADSMPEMVWTSDEKGELNYFNNAVYDYTGLDIEGMQGKAWST